MTKITLPEPTVVKGYRVLTEDMKQRMNQNKILEELVLRQLDRMVAEPDNDPRLIAIARTHFMEGFMSMNRAIARPGRVEGQITGDLYELIDELTR